MIYRFIKRLIPTNAVTISIVVFIVASLIVTYISRNYYDDGFMENVLAEAHGMLFDILVIGVIILFLNRLAEKRTENQRYLDEIDDFRGWKSDEAAYRIAGSIRRLNRNNYKGKIDLNACYLPSVDLVEESLRGADLENANLHETTLMKAETVNNFV